MATSLSLIASELGMSIWLLVVIMAWSLVWKLAALWKSARKGSLIWFIILALINTVGILEILYIFVLSKMDLSGKKKKVKKKSRKKKK